jgi:hypothetical protein
MARYRVNLYHCYVRNEDVIMCCLLQVCSLYQRFMMYESDDYDGNTEESKVRPITHPKAERGGGRGIALLFIDLGTRRGGWSAPRPGRFTPSKDPVPIVQEAGWAPGPVWTCAKNLDPTGIRSPDRPYRSQSQYRLSYPGPTLR